MEPTLERRDALFLPHQHSVRNIRAAGVQELPLIGHLDCDVVAAQKIHIGEIAAKIDIVPVAHARQPYFESRGHRHRRE